MVKHTFVPQLSQADQLLCAILRDEALSRSQLGALMTSPNILAILEAHGVTSLVYHKLRHYREGGHEGAEGWTALTQQARRHTAESLLRKKALRQVLNNLAAHGVCPLLLKGMPLGYTHYPAPEMRPCCDTDLLVRQRDIQRVDQVLRDLGYIPCTMPSGQFVMHQLTYAKTGLAGVERVVDVHWKISNRQVFANCLSFDELAPKARPVPRLGDSAFALAPEHALLHACLHRIAHQDQRGRLIWLYDLHLLVGRMTPDEIDRFAGLAANKELRAVCWSGLSLAQHCFATPLPHSLVAVLRPSQSGSKAEASAYFITPRQRPWQMLFSDLCALPGWFDRLHLIKEHLFPPKTYMLDRYAAGQHAWLPVLYMHRLLRGLIRFWQAVN